MTDREPYRHRFPLSIIQHAVWLDHRFPSSYRDVQELLHRLSIVVSHEILRQWNIKLAPLLTEELRHREPRRGSRWFLDEVCVEIGSKKFWLWRAVGKSGAVLDVLLQTHRDTQAAKTFFERLFINDNVPDAVHTDKLWSSGAAPRALLVLHNVEHIQVIAAARCNKLTKQSHRPTRNQERSQLGLTTPQNGQGVQKVGSCRVFLQ